MALRVNSFGPHSSARLSHRLIAALVTASALALAPGMLVVSPASAEQWKAGECEADVDDGGEPIKVCDDGYHMAVFWNDGSFVNGACTEDGSYNVDYKGISKSDAIAWVKEFCGD
jgi:hypothetical protein